MEVLVVRCPLQQLLLPGRFVLAPVTTAQMVVVERIEREFDIQVNKGGGGRPVQGIGSEEEQGSTRPSSYVQLILVTRI